MQDFDLVSAPSDPDGSGISHAVGDQKAGHYWQDHHDRARYFGRDRAVLFYGRRYCIKNI